MDVEAKLVTLGKQYQEARSELTKGKLRKLTDIYKKQAKLLNIRKIQQNKTRENSKDIYPIDEETENESEEIVSVMSDITIKTVNSSYKSPNKVQETDWSTRKSGEKKERKEKEPPEKPVLESLGKTRKHSATNLQNQTNMKSRSGKAIQITQNDGTIVSEDKLPHNTTKKTKQK